MRTSVIDPEFMAMFRGSHFHLLDVLLHPQQRLATLHQGCDVPERTKGRLGRGGPSAFGGVAYLMMLNRWTVVCPFTVMFTM